MNRKFGNNDRATARHEVAGMDCTGNQTRHLEVSKVGKRGARRGHEMVSDLGCWRMI
jgi:hypothetical protein